MAAITPILNGDSGLQARDNINGIHDEIIKITGNYSQLQADDIIVATAATPIEILLIEDVATSAIKDIRVINDPTSVSDVTLTPFGSDTINGNANLIIPPGITVVLTPTESGWLTGATGAVESVNSGTNITVDNTDPDNPIVNLPTDITSQAVNGVTLISGGSSSNVLFESGVYGPSPSSGVQSVSGGTGINISGTAEDPVVNVDDELFSQEINGVSLTATAGTDRFLNGSGFYTVPTGEIVEVTTTYNQVVLDDIIIASPSISFFVNLIPIATAVKAIVIRNDGAVSVTIDPDATETIDGQATFVLQAGDSITLVPTSGTDWLEIAEAGVESVSSGTNISVDNTDPANPVVNLPSDITSQAVNGVTLVGTGAATNFLDESGAYSVPASSGAQLSSFTVQISNEDDINAAFGASPWFVANVNIQLLENITLTSGNRFVVETATTTFVGVGREFSSFIVDNVAGEPFIDFTAQSGSIANITLELHEMKIVQTGAGPSIRVNGEGFILKRKNVDITGNSSGGNIEYLNGVFGGMEGGVVQGGANIVQGDGTSDNPGVQFIIHDASAVMITDLFADDQRLIELMPNSVTRRFLGDIFSQLINPDFGFTPPRTGGIGLYVHKSAKVKIFDWMNGGFNPISATSRQFVFEDPASIKFLQLEGNDQAGAGELYQFSPTAPDSTIVLTNARGITIDPSGDLYACIDDNSAASSIQKFVGTTSTTNGAILAPDNRPSDIDWYRGNLISLGFGAENDGVAYLHDKFTTSTVSVSLATLGIQLARGIATDGTNIIILGANDRKVSIFGPDFFTATTPVAIKTFIIPGVGSLRGCSYDGVNLTVACDTGNFFMVLKGITPIVQYTFAAQSTNPIGITHTLEGYAESDQGAGEIDIFSHSFTIDHSAATFNVMSNTGEQEQIKVDPIDETLWTPGNSGTVSDAGGVITLTNGATAVGFIDFPLICVPGNTYRVTNGYTPGTAPSATFFILDEALGTITSQVASVAGDVVLTFTPGAGQQFLTFRVQNGSVVSGETSILTSLANIDESYKIVESSDKGGSIFKNSVAQAISPVLAENVASTISDGGVNILYAPFTKREKSHLKNENTGELEITSVRDSGKTFTGSFTGMALGASNGEYELLVSIRGEIQEDSVGSAIFTGNNDIRSIYTQQITRDVTDTNEVELVLRPTFTSPSNLGVFRSSLSFTE